MKFLKTIRFDVSDKHVFERAAEADEWAVSGAFWFSSWKRDDISGKIKQAFSNGFLSLESFGFSTFVTVCEMDDTTYQKLVAVLGVKLFEDFGAPSQQAAKEAATGEIDYIIGLCDELPINTLLAVSRDFDGSDEIRERFNTVEMPTDPVHTRIWEIVE